MDATLLGQLIALPTRFCGLLDHPKGMQSRRPAFADPRKATSDAYYNHLPLFKRIR